MSDICYSDKTPCEMCNDTQSVEVLPDGCNNGNDTMLDECPWCLRRKLNQQEAELTALREQLAAAEADDDTISRLLNSHLAEAQKWKERLEATDASHKDFRAAVAAALAELRKQMADENDTANWLAKLDTTIPKLGLQEQSK